MSGLGVTVNCTDEKTSSSHVSVQSEKNGNLLLRINLSLINANKGREKTWG